MSYPNQNSFEQIRKDNGVSDTDLLKLMDILTLHEASALIAGCSPNQVRTDDYNGEIYYSLDTNRNDPENAQEVFSISLKAMVKAIENGLLRANIKVNVSNCGVVQLSKDNLQSDWTAIYGISEANTTVTREDLKDWLEKRGVYPTMLFPNGKKDDYMNPEHEHYSPKLALCVRAWEVAQTANLQGETYKQFIEKWMRENARNFKVENKRDSDIFDVLSSISNWATKGGRTKANPTPHNEPLNDPKEVAENLATVHQKLAVNLPDKIPTVTDDDVPF